MKYVLLLLIALPSLVHADGLSALKGSSTYVGVNSGVASREQLLPGDASGANRLEMLFGSDQPAIFKNDGSSFPPLPRFWGVEGTVDYAESTTGANLTLGPAMAEVNFTYRYEITTTFHYLGSVSLLQRQTDENLVTLLPEDFQKVFRVDQNTLLDYFNVSAKNPMVGMCQYEIALYHGVTAKGGITWFLKSVTEGGKVQFSRLSVYSKTFNLKSQADAQAEARQAGFTVSSDNYQGDGFDATKYSLAWYKEKFCGENFNKTIKPYVEEAFSLKAIQYNANNNPANTCTLANRDLKNVGDESCAADHTSLNKSLQKMTVSRCEIQKNGSTKCMLRAKEKMPCPLYQKRGGGFSDKYQGYYSEATLTDFGSSCDKGLICTMDKNPIQIGSMILWPGSASCKKQGERK